MEGIKRENQIQILTQTPFLMQVVGRVMLDLLESQSSTTNLNTKKCQDWA